MYVPGQRLSQEIVDMFIAAFNDDRVKAEMYKKMKTELDNDRLKYSYGGTKFQNYNSLTSGDVNTQAKMAASGYEVYGRTLLEANNPYTNGNVYRKMRNKIKFGRAPQAGFTNRGRFTVA